MPSSRHLLALKLPNLLSEFARFDDSRDSTHLKGHSLGNVISSFCGGNDTIGKGTLLEGEYSVTRLELGDGAVDSSHNPRPLKPKKVLHFRGRSPW